MRQTRFEIYTKLTLRGRRWYWRLRAANGEPIASGEAYNSAEAARKGIELVRSAGEKTPVAVVAK